MTRASGAITALFVAAALLYAGNGLQGTLLAVRGGLEGFTALSIGLIMSAYFIGYILGCRLIPNIVAAVGHIRVFTALASIASAAALAHAMLIDVGAWWLFRAATGFCIAGLAMVAESWINEQTSNHHRGRVLGLYRMVDLGAVTAGQFLLTLAAPTGFFLFGMISILISLSLVPIALTPATAPPPLVTSRLDLPGLWRISPLAMAGCFLVGLGNTPFWGLAPTFIQQQGLDTELIAHFMAVTILAGAVTQWPLGLLSDLFDRRILLMFAAAGAVGGALTIIWLPVGYGSLTIGAALFGAFALPLFGLCIALANDLAPPGTYVGVNAGLLLLFGLGAIIGPLLAPLVMHRLGPEGLFWFIAGIFLLLFFIGFGRYMFARRQRRWNKEGFFAVTPITVASPTAFELDPRSQDRGALD